MTSVAVRAGVKRLHEVEEQLHLDRYVFDLQAARIMICR